MKIDQTAHQQAHQVDMTLARKKTLVEKIPSLRNKRVLIVGDVGLDEYIMGEVRRISPEAPVPVLEVNSEENRLGLAANVAQNVASLGGVPLLVSVVGKDAGAGMLDDLFAKSNVSSEHLIRSSLRPTTRKTRVMTGHHHIVRVDHEIKRFLEPEIEKQVLSKVEGLVTLADVIVIEDYAKGVITADLIQKICALGKSHGKRVMLDPHRDNPAEFYRGVDLIKPNYDESVILSGLNFDDLRDKPNKVMEVGLALQKKIGAKEVVITRGKEGMTIFSDHTVTEVPTYALKVFDVTGAGDTVIAAMALGLASGMDLTEACMLANFAAGVVVGKIGCVPCEIPELIEYIQEVHA